MKHTYSHLLGTLIMLITAFTVNAQLVYISDADVRSRYNQWVPGCVDGNGYLDPAFPGVATFDQDNASIYPNADATIEGLDAFVALRHLGLGGGLDIDLTILAMPPALEDLSAVLLGNVTWPALPSTLKSLHLESSPMPLPTLPEGLEKFTAFDLMSVTTFGTLPSTLVEFHVFDMTSLIDFGTFPAGLRWLTLNGSFMNPGSLDFTGVTDLRHLLIWAVPFETLPPLPASLEFLQLSQLHHLQSFTLPPDLDSLFIGGTPLANVPALPSTLTYLSCYGVHDSNGGVTLPALPATLQKLVFWNSTIQSLPPLPASLLELRFQESYSITCLPLLPEGLQVLELDGANFSCLPNDPPGCVITAWPVTPGICETLNTICAADGAEFDGQVFDDIDQNGVQDVGELGSSYVMLSVEPLGLVGGVPSNGHFTVELPPGDYTISCAPTSSFVQSIAPASHTASLADVNSTDSGNDFGLDLTPGNDFAVNMVANVARPGFNNGVWINVRNLSTEVLDADVQFTFDADQSWMNSDVVPTSLVGNTATWTLPAMAMGELRVIHIVLYTDPSTLLGTSIDHVASVDPPVGDIDAGNDSFALHDEVIGSFDPNDKAVSPSVIDQSELSTAELTYTIRFQNTGNYQAERVIITDTLSTSLDWNTFRFVASSHTCNWTLFNGVLRFTFEPIFLPDSAADEPGSHGFVTFTMEPMANAALGLIGNIANIYFDYNQPVITNEAVVEIATGVAEEDADLMRVFPVPTEETLWLERSEGTSVRCAIIDAQGREVFAVQAVGTLVAIPVAELPAGAYVLRTNSGDAPLPFLKR